LELKGNLIVARIIVRLKAISLSFLKMNETLVFFRGPLPLYFGKEEIFVLFN